MSSAGEGGRGHEQSMKRTFCIPHRRVTMPVWPPNKPQIRNNREIRIS